MPLLPQDAVLKSTSDSASLVELYSSEGCSSCPPAEAWIGKLKNDPGLWKNIFPVAFHVDYWDGLGWPDRFASAAYTQRQRDYAARLGQDSVYTPEFVVNGAEWRGWFDGGNIPSTGKNKSGRLTLTVKKSGGEISAEYVSNAPAQPPLQLNLALLGTNVVSDIKAGENSGRTLTHDFVVLSFVSTPLNGDKHGGFHNAPIVMKSSTSDTPTAIVAWVTTPDGYILQVTGGWLSNSDQARN